MRISIRQACVCIVPGLVAVSLIGCGGGEALSSTPPTLTAVGAAGPPAGPLEVQEYRHRNHGGVSRLIAVSLQELDLTTAQRATLEKLKDDVLAKMDPVRAAGRDLTNLLADGVAAGSVDRAKAEALTARVGEASARLHESILADLDLLHATLTPEQRAALVDKMQSRWAIWSEARRDANLSGEAPPRDLDVLALRLGLSREQVDRIEARFTAAMEGAVLDYYPRDVENRMQAFASSFKGDAFEARTLPTVPFPAPRPASFGATRMTRFFEAVAPELGATQRALLAADLRDHASRHDQP